MRSVIIALPLLALATPAAAQPDPRDADIVRALPSQHELDDMGDMIGRALSAMMDIDIGGLADAIDPEDDHRPHRDRTLGDLARRDDPYSEERMQRSVAAATANMGDVVADIAILTPRLRRSLDDLARDIEDATRDLPDRTYRRR